MRDQCDYTARLIDCIEYCQIGGIALRCLDETKNLKIQDSF